MTRWSGTFFDGETPRSHRVEVTFETDALEIFGQAGLLARWEYEGLRRVPGTSRETGMIEITPSFQSDERLKFEDPRAVKALRTIHPQIDLRPPTNHKAIARALGWTGAAIALWLVGGRRSICGWAVRRAFTAPGSSNFSRSSD